MRELLFRGKRIDNGEWVDGDLINNHDGRKFVGKVVVDDYKGTANDTYEVGIGFVEVDPSTVGQYTGLTDKNGKKIFEGDIIQNVAGFVFGDQYKAVVKIGGEKHGTYAGCYFAESSLIDIDAYDFDYCEVIGNATDNPELLEVGE